jgi:hypothetical protein
MGGMIARTMAPDHGDRASGAVEKQLYREREKKGKEWRAVQTARRTAAARLRA